MNKGKQINQENNYKLNYLIYNCINIEKSISEINQINQKIEKFILMKDIEIKFSPPNENYLYSILEVIKNFGKIYYNDFKYSFIKYEDLNNVVGPKIDFGIDIKGPSLDIPRPDFNILGSGIDIQGPSFGIPTPNFNIFDIQGPKIDEGIGLIGLPGVDIQKNRKKKTLNIDRPSLDIPKPDLNIQGPRLDAGIGLPLFDISETKIDSGIGLPGFDIHGPKLGGIEIAPINVIKSPKLKMNINPKRKYEISGDKDNILTKKGEENNWMGAICQNELENGQKIFGKSRY